ncbi:hypothetical protein [Alteromonas sp. AMM-1]|uniref:hypothetical protein n=1 Tax=Alteromonas sp. AMM-1 TaxID=3394233 RepID=UPI0039A547D5
MRVLKLMVLLLLWQGPVLADTCCPVIYTGNQGATLNPGEVVSSPDVPVADPSGLFAWVKTGQHDGYLIPVEGDASKLHFNLLWHPALPWQGGQAQIVLTNGETACPAVTVNIAPLQRADGAFDAMLALLRQGVDNESVPLGQDYESLSTQTDSDVPAWQVLAAFSASLYDNDDPNGFANALAQLRADPELSESLALMEGLLFATGILETMYNDLDLRAEALRAPDNTEPMPPQSQLWRLPDAGLRQLYPHTELTPLLYEPELHDTALQVQVNATTNAPAPSLNIAVFKDARSLSEAMYAQFHSETGLLPDVQIYRDAAGSLLTAGSALATAHGAKALASFYSRVGEGLFLWTMLDKLRDGLYPNAMIDMKIDASNNLIYVQSKPDSGVVNAIWVTPKAKGLDMSKIALDFVLQVLPVNKVAGARTGSHARRTANHEILGRPLTGAAEQQFQRTLQKAHLNDGMLEGVLDTSKWTILGKIIEKLPGNGVIAPFTYPPVNIYQRGYVDLKLSKTGVVTVDFPEDGLMVYQASAAGRVLLNAYTRSGKFGNTNATAEYEVRVRESQGLYISPANPIVMPGESVRLFIAWGGEEQALPPQFAVNVDTLPAGHQFRLSSKPERLTINGYPQWAYTLDVTTQSNMQLFPVHVTASLKSRPEISAKARIDPTAIVPGTGCIEPDSSVTFSVPITGGKSMPGISWRVAQGPGQISQSGLYEAPANAKKGEQVRIEARSPKGMVLTRDMRLSCGCEWRLNAYGQQWEGNNVYVTRYNDTNNQPSHMLHAGNDDSTIVVASGQAPQLGSLLGVLNATVGAYNLFTNGCNDENRDNLCDPDEPREGDPVAPPPASYTITATDGGFVQGVISGQAIEGHRLTGKQSVLPATPFSFHFRAKVAQFNMQDLGIAQALAMSAGDTSEQTLAQFAQLGALFGGESCNTDPEWEDAKRKRGPNVQDDDDAYTYPEEDDGAQPPEDESGQMDTEETDNPYDYADNEENADGADSSQSTNALPDHSIPLLPELTCIAPGQVINFHLPPTHSPLREMLVIKVDETRQLGPDWRYQAPAVFSSPFVRVGLYEKYTGMRLANYIYPAGCSQSH